MSKHHAADTQVATPKRTKEIIAKHGFSFKKKLGAEFPD